MAIAYAFRSNTQFVNYALKSGQIAKFVNGLFHTTNEKVAEELRAVAEEGHPDIYIDAKEPTVDTDALTPEAQLEKRIRAKIMQEMAEATSHSRDLGTYSTDTSASMVTTRSAGQLANQQGQVTTIPLANVLAASAEKAEVNPHDGEMTAEEKSAVNLSPLAAKLAELAAQKQK